MRLYRRSGTRPVSYLTLLLKLSVSIVIILFFQWLLAYGAVPVYARPDLFLYLVVCAGGVMKPINHLCFAIFLGYLMDALSGRLWGFYIATYCFAVAFIHLTSDQAEIKSLPYQIVLAGLCALLQGLFLVFYITNSYEFFGDLRGFIVSTIGTRVLVTVLGAALFTTFMFKWLTGDYEF